MYKKNESSCLHVRDGFLIHISVRIVTIKSLFPCPYISIKEPYDVFFALKSPNNSDFSSPKNWNLVDKLPTFYRTKTHFTYKIASNRWFSRKFADRYTASIHILRIRQFQIGYLVGNSQAGLLHPNTFYA